MSDKQPETTHDAFVQPLSERLIDRFLWDAERLVVTVAADRSLGSALRRMRDERAYWLVIVRTPPGSAEVYYYAFRITELEKLAEEFPERKKWTIESAMSLNEGMSSRTCRNQRPTSPAYGQHGPAAGRIIDFDTAGCIMAIGEREDLVAHSSDDSKKYALRLRPMRRAEEIRAAGAGAEIEVTLSAETKAEIGLGAEKLVDFRIELASEAVPLAVSQAAIAQSELPITVSLTVENNVIEIVRDREHTLAPPATKQPRTGFFVVKGVRVGVSRLAVLFRQGGSDLGIISLAVEVVQAGARSAQAHGDETATYRDIADDDKLMVLVEPRTDGGQMLYEYFLHSEQLGLIHRVRSKPFLDRGGGPAATQLAFVERVYDLVTKELNVMDLQRELKELQRQTRALGASLCRELFDPEVTKVLWPLRDRIKQIQIVSWEPYIPWELVRLCDPESGAIDDRFLAEYGLVRTLSDQMPPRELPMKQWAYLGATFPMHMLPPVGAELEYFTGKSPDTLRGHGIEPVPIDATRDDFYEALAELDFDVLHISCHAESPHQSIERATLIIGDETPLGASKPRLVEVDAVTVQAEAQLKRHRPLVFLNACETGRVGAVLTAWGGWPNVFLRSGAAAFVGAAWAVRDKPAAAFATAFYNALLAGKTLTEAASAARAATKKLGDASWLAFKVYGHPRARRGSPSSEVG